MPRPAPLPPASTASALAARKAFYCDLCQKGYARMNEYEAHEGSYDHQHKKRLKEMKEMQRSVKGVSDANRPVGGEKGPLMKIQLGGKKEEGAKAGGGGFKKGGFKNAFAPADEPMEEKVKDEEGTEDVKMNEKVGQDGDSDVTDDEDYYDPRRPTGCMPGCPGRVS